MQEHSIAEEEALILSKLDKKPFYLGEVVTKISIYSGITTFGIFNVFFTMYDKSRKKLFNLCKTIILISFSIILFYPEDIP